MLDLKMIGRKLIELRQNQNLTQEDVAAKLFVTHQAVSRWETGKALPTIDNCIELVKIYQAPIETILCLEEPLLIIDKDAFLEEHDREYAIHEVVLGKVKELAIADILYRLTPQERLYALHLLTKHNIPADDSLWPRLSLSERIWLLREWRDKGYSLCTSKIRHMLTPAEAKIVKEVYHENRKNVAVSRKRRTE